MKMRAKLAMLALALVVLVGAWLLAEYMSGGYGSAQETQPAEPEIVDLSAGLERDITALSWSYEGETVNLIYNGTSWENADDQACPIDSQLVESLVQAVCSLSATVVSRDVEDVSVYGLDDPVLVIMAATADHIAAYEVGSRSTGGGYYLRVGEGSTVYAEGGSLTAAFRLGLADILSCQALPQDVAQVTAMWVQTDVDSYTLVYDPEQGLLQYDGRYSWFCRRQEEDSPLDETLAQALCSSVADMELLSCVSWSGEDLAQYGLAQPQGTVTLSYLDGQGQSQQLCLAFGDYADGAVYVRLADSPVVYLAEGTVLDGLMYPDWSAMTPLDVCPLDWQEVTQALVALEGHTYDICRYEETTQVEYRDDRQPREVTEVIYSASGWILDTDLVQTWLQDLTALLGEALADDTAGRELLFSVTLTLDDPEQSPLSLAFYTYDSAQCLCVVNDSQRLFVSRSDAIALTDQIARILIVE